jgi:hypothetical protein
MTNTRSRLACDDLFGARRSRRGRCSTLLITEFAADNINECNLAGKATTCISRFLFLVFSLAHPVLAPNNPIPLVLMLSTPATINDRSRKESHASSKPAGFLKVSWR